MPTEQKGTGHRLIWPIVRVYAIISPVLAMWRLTQLKTGMYFGVNEGLRREHPPQEWSKALAEFPGELAMILLVLGLLAVVHIGLDRARE